MTNRFLTALFIMVAVASMRGKVYAQSSNTGNYTINGNSLTNIDNRTADNDYARFFSEKNSQNNSGNNVGETVAPAGVWQIGDQVELRRNEPRTTPNDVIFPQGDESFYNNNGVQVQLGLGDNR
ncbi:hypothetical protein BZZ01_08745 [Nostocales cyanobacterium HT-58-2]|nr:hypothetical protein BZZ01_08745 [Nostocales cyanobacterium HT-58-2]